MENKLALQSLPLDEVMSMAKTFADSGMFTDAKQQAQAFVKIIAGQEIGIPPFAAISGIHIVQGKPTIGAGLIASCIKGSGKYDYKVKQLDDKACSIDFFQAKEKLGNSTFTIEDAVRAQTKNLEKFPKNMLFARAISNGVKWFCPDVFSGPVYTPEEMNGTEDIPHLVIDSETTNKEREQAPAVVLPGMPDKAFGQLIERLKAGETGLVEKVKETFTLNQSQLDTIESLLVYMPLDQFTVLIADISMGTKANATAMLKEARTKFSFIAEQEAEITQAIAGLTTKKAA